MRIAAESLPCGLVTGKSLMSVAIVLENAFRAYNGRLGDYFIEGADPLVISAMSPCTNCVHDLERYSEPRQEPSAVFSVPLVKLCMAV